MNGLRFWKLQSIGNDFPLVHEEEGGWKALPELARSMCDRRFGVGGDGLLALARLGPGRLRLRMFNPDGTEDFCGNGLRCAAVHAKAIGWVGDEFSIEHLRREVQVRARGDLVSTRLPPATYDPGRVPLGEREELFRAPLPLDGVDALVGSALSTGSTHVVLPVAAPPRDQEFREVSARIETAPLFPERTSVIWAWPEGEAVRVRIWERGVGETLGCGSGAAAVAVDLARVHGKGERLEVRAQGGSVYVTVDPWQAGIEIEGVAERLFEGRYLAPSGLRA